MWGEGGLSSQGAVPPQPTIILAVLDSEDSCAGEWAGVLMSRRACSYFRCGCLDHAEFSPLVRVANDGLASEVFSR